MRVAMVIPALDEADNLRVLLPAIPPGIRVIVVDNDSADDTAHVARSLGAEVVNEPRRGYGSAILAGMAALRRDPPEVLVILDADGANDPVDVEHLLLPIREDRADLVLSDRSRSSEPGALTPVQRFGNALATALIRRSTGHPYRDLGPFRAIRWSALEALGMRDPTWGWNVEMQMKAVHHGLRILEVPLPYRSRVHGESKISGTLVGAARAGGRILQAVHRYR